MPLPLHCSPRAADPPRCPPRLATMRRLGAGRMSAGDRWQESTLAYIYRHWHWRAWTQGRAAVVAAVLTLMALLLADGPVIAWARTMHARGEQTLGWLLGGATEAILGQSRRSVAGEPMRDLAQRLTHLGRSDWVLIPLGLLLAAALAGRVLGRRLRCAGGGGARRWRRLASVLLGEPWRRLTVISAWAFASIAGTGLFVHVPKSLVGRARPAFIEGAGPLELHPLAFSSYRYASFPSGHACVAGALTAVLCILLPRWWWLWVALGVTVAWTRCVIGVHYPSDVVAGFWIGAAGTLLLRRWLMASSHRTDLCLWPADRPLLSLLSPRH